MGKRSKDYGKKEGEGFQKEELSWRKGEKLTKNGPEVKVK